jgi:hypothetical protein
MFWPYAEAESVDGAQYRRHSYYERERREEDDWPACWGKCQAGKCIFDQAVDYPGCCHVQHRRVYGSSAATADDTVKAPEASAHQAGESSDQKAGEESVKAVEAPGQAVDAKVAGSTGLYCWKGAE